jgi:transposase InsO family protein
MRKTNPVSGRLTAMRLRSRVHGARLGIRHPQDLFRCQSIVLRSYWVLVVMDQFTRRLVGVGVHCGPVNGADVCRMFNAAIHGQNTPRHLSTDHDPLFEAHRWKANLRILEVDEVKTVPHVPLSHPFVERLIGTMRRGFYRSAPFVATCPGPALGSLVVPAASPSVFDFALPDVYASRAAPSKAPPVMRSAGERYGSAPQEP